MGRKRKNRGGKIVGHQHQHPIEEDPLTIKSSWFGDEKIKWVSRHDDTINGESSSSLQKYPNINDGSGGSINSTANDIAEVPATQHQSLTAELNQLKEQFMPLAKSCADAINDTHNNSLTTANATNNNSKTATTPQYEFRQARSICNPYERFGETSIRPHWYNNNSKRQRRHHERNKKSSSFQFVNRSAIKLANIDALLGFALTRCQQSPPPSSDTKTIATDTTPLSNTKDETNTYFAFVDLCGAPGGFSEYILYRHMHPIHQHHVGEQKSADNTDSHSREVNCTQHTSNNLIRPCYGFGMSLSGRNDEGKGVRWDLNHLKKHYHLQSNEDLSLANNIDVTTKEDSKATLGNKCNNKKQLLHYHVCRGADGTGSIYNWDNVLELQRQVSMHLSRQNDTDKNESTQQQQQQQHKVHLVVADGGFDAQRDSNNQEELAHHIVVSQTAAALSLLREGGTYIVKMFGFDEESTKQMLRYLYGYFDKMTFVKPTSSRPASAERYLVCCGYNGVGSGWDGLAWKQHQMDMTTSSTILPNNEVVYDCTPLDNLANEFDIDMLKLNVESCRSIVDYLRKKSEGEDAQSAQTD